MPQFDYCSTIWVKEKGKEMNKLFKIQKRAARIILHQSVKTASAPLFAKSKLRPYLVSSIFISS